MSEVRFYENTQDQTKLTIPAAACQKSVSSGADWPGLPEFTGLLNII